MNEYMHNFTGYCLFWQCCIIKTMNIFLKFWNNFKTRPDVWFFYGFLITFPLTIRKVIIFYPINSQFNEYTGIYLYLSDIFLIITLFLWGISILRNKNTNLSIDNAILWLKQAITYLPLLLVFWSFISILWSENQNVALFKAIKLLELFLLYLYVIFRLFHLTIPLSLPRRGNEGEVVNKGGVIKNILHIIIALGFMQAIIGIWQFIIQHPVGLFWLKESLISPNVAGVAKIILDGEKYVRSYGLFPHPNILGGFLILSIILTFYYKKMFHVEYLVSVKQSSVCHSELNSGSTSIRFRISARGGSHAYRQAGAFDGKSGMTILLLIQVIALILTFSKSAIIGLFIAVLYILWKNKEMFHLRRNVPRVTFFGTGVEHFGKKAIIIATILIVAFILAKPNLDSFLAQSLKERNLYLNVSPALNCSMWNNLISGKRETINSLKVLILGLGNGQFVINLKSYPVLIIESWQFQPVHNVFLLILSELGLVGLIIFVWFLWKLFHLTLPLSLPRRGNKGEVFKGIFLAFIFIMLFDHYLWDIQQGQIMLWMILGFLAGNKITKD